MRARILRRVLRRCKRGWSLRRVLRRWFALAQSSLFAWLFPLARSLVFPFVLLVSGSRARARLRIVSGSSQETVSGPSQDPETSQNRDGPHRRSGGVHFGSRAHARACAPETSHETRMRAHARLRRARASARTSTPETRAPETPRHAATRARASDVLTHVGLPQML